MGQKSSRALVVEIRRAVRENRRDLPEVELKDLQLTERAVRKLADALRKNE